MQFTIATVLLLLAFIVLVLSAAGIAARINLQSLGLALIALAMLATTIWR